MKIKDTTFEQIKEIKSDGLVLLGCGGNLNEWVEGVKTVLRDEHIVTSQFKFTEAFKLTTTGGRVDLLLLFNPEKVDMSKLAIWRINWGDCSWLSDYKVNYAEQHGFVTIEKRYENCSDDLDEDDWAIND